MTQWSPNASFVVTSSEPAAPQITFEWRRWLAENLLRRVPPQNLVEAMMREGFDQATAVAEIKAAIEHPYLAASRAVPSGDFSNPEPKVKKRDWVLEIYRRCARQGSAFGTVPRRPALPRQQFLDEFYARNQPVVMTGALSDWPALTAWTGDALKAKFGDRMVEVQANRTADADYEINSVRLKKEMRFGDYVDLVETAEETNAFYMTANNSQKNKSALRELWDDIGPLPEYLRHDDPENRGFFWYGPKGTITPLHHDLTNNFMAQVRGRKLVRLIAPYELPHMYNHRHCFSRVNLDRVDLDQYPQFANVTVVDVEIGPGDLLFLPVGWWHHVRGLDVTITMTFTNFVFDNDFYSFYTTYQEI